MSRRWQTSESDDSDDPERTFEDEQAQSTILYDCSVDLRIETPNEKDMKIDWILKTTLIAMAHEMASKHPDCDNMELIHFILRKTISATQRNFKIVKKNRARRALERNVACSGHILGSLEEDKVFYDAFEFSGQVAKDWYYKGPITVDYTVKLFMSAGEGSVLMPFRYYYH